MHTNWGLQSAIPTVCDENQKEQKVPTSRAPETDADLICDQDNQAFHAYGVGDVT